MAHGTRTLLLREIKLRPVEDEEPAVASAAEVAQLREAECLAEAERRAAAAQAAAAAAAARAMVDAATAATRDAAVQAAVAANAVQIVLHGKLVPVTCQVEARRCMYRFMYSEVGPVSCSNPPRNCRPGDGRCLRNKWVLFFSPLHGGVNARPALKGMFPQPAPSCILYRSAARRLSSRFRKHALVTVALYWVNYCRCGRHWKLITVGWLFTWYGCKEEKRWRSRSDREVPCYR